MKNIIVIEGAEIEDQLNEAYKKGYRIVSQSSVGLECTRAQGYKDNSTAFITTVILQLPEEKEELNIVRKADLTPGDIVVLKCPYNISNNNRDTLTANMKKRFPDHKVIVLDGDMNIEIAKETKTDPQDKEYSMECVNCLHIGLYPVDQGDLEYTKCHACGKDVHIKSEAEPPLGSG